MTYFWAWDFLLPRTVSSETVVRFQQFAGSKATGDELDGMLHLVRTVRTFSRCSCAAQCFPMFMEILFTHSFHFMYQTNTILLQKIFLRSFTGKCKLFLLVLVFFRSLSLFSLACFSSNKNNFLGVSFAFIIFPRFFPFFFPKKKFHRVWRRKTEK